MPLNENAVIALTRLIGTNVGELAGTPVFSVSGGNAATVFPYGGIMTDFVGGFNINTPAAGMAAGKQGLITFSQPFANNPKVFLSPNSLLASAVGAFIYNISQVAFEVWFTNAGIASTAYGFFYLAIG